MKPEIDNMFILYIYIYPSQMKSISKRMMIAEAVCFGPTFGKKQVISFRRLTNAPAHMKKGFRM